MIELESTEAEVPQPLLELQDLQSADSVQLLLNYMTVNTILLQTLIRDLEAINERLP